MNTSWGFPPLPAADEVMDAAETGASVGENSSLKSNIMSWII